MTASCLAKTTLLSSKYAVSFLVVAVTTSQADNDNPNWRTDKSVFASLRSNPGIIFLYMPTFPKANAHHLLAEAQVAQFLTLFPVAPVPHPSL